jgi:hypothetical protein
MRRLFAISAAALFGVVSAKAAQAQGIDRALEMEIAREFLALELAGWRLPDPTETCLTGLDLKRLEPMAFGSSELIDQPDLVDPPGPHYRNIRVEPESGDARTGQRGRRRVARFDWLLAKPDGTQQAEADSFVFVINDAGGDRGAAAMVKEPSRLVIRRECFGG